MKKILDFTIEKAFSLELNVTAVRLGVQIGVIGNSTETLNSGTAITVSNVEMFYIMYAEYPTIEEFITTLHALQQTLNEKLTE